MITPGINFTNFKKKDVNKKLKKSFLTLISEKNDLLLSLCIDDVAYSVPASGRCQSGSARASAWWSWTRTAANPLATGVWDHVQLLKITV